MLSSFHRTMEPPWPPPTHDKASSANQPISVGTLLLTSAVVVLCVLQIWTVIMLRYLVAESRYQRGPTSATVASHGSVQSEASKSANSAGPKIVNLSASSVADNDRLYVQLGSPRIRAGNALASGNISHHSTPSLEVRPKPKPDSNQHALLFKPACIVPCNVPSLGFRVWVRVWVEA